MIGASAKLVGENFHHSFLFLPIPTRNFLLLTGEIKLTTSFLLTVISRRWPEGMIFIPQLPRSIGTPTTSHTKNCGLRSTSGQWRRSGPNPNPSKSQAWEKRPKPRVSIDEIVRAVVPSRERLVISAPTFANQGFCDPHIRRVADCPSEPAAVNYAHDAKPIVAEIDTVDSWEFGQTLSLRACFKNGFASNAKKSDRQARQPAKRAALMLF